ncbi:CotH kinase family protein [Glycomyces dulcitolivorans]|uniref:CotH kinase family protein n=1 Tax=Glycomyces dulcitolivorans TaxID=2200759 RepID=UPI000DD45AE8|nr:CotH kinase family protein [Glycomyces dulcitolivorans]
MARKKLRHRIPVSLRHYWKLIAGSVGLIAVLTLAVGTVRATALVYSDANEGFVVTNDIQGTVDLFDTSVAHEISLSYSDADYDDMIETFEDSGEKEWIKADITIDGVTISDVGIRLKGNSTLSALGGGAMGGGEGGGMPEGMELPEGVELPEGMEGMVMPGGDEGGMGGMGGSTISFEDPETLPWLVDFSKYVDGQVYQGNQQISLRVDSAMGGTQEGTSLNEAVTLELLEASGQSSYDWTYSTVSVNGGEAVTRRVVDIMDVTWAEDTYGENTGVLYKALSTGSFEYQGADPEEYEDDFKQLSMKGSYDAQPIIDFLEWLGEADDATFDAELGDWVDVESFATYTAFQNLVTNGDDMAGPGKNFYLWYDFDTGLISILTWDVDLTLQTAELAPDETASIGGGGGGFGGELPEGVELPEGMEMPAGGDEAEGGRGEGDGGGGMGGGMGGNELKERFLASEAFQDEYMAAYQDLYGTLLASGAALEAVDTAQAAAELSGADVASSAESLKAIIQQRTDFLAEELAAESAAE